MGYVAGGLGIMPMLWYGAQALEHVRDLAAPRVERAGRVFRDFLRKRVSVPNVDSAALARYAKGGKGISRGERGGNPSDPGEYPRKVSGHLRRNIQAEFDRSILTSRVGTNVIYGKHLETGTRKMKRRPWMSRGLLEARSLITRALGS